MRSASPRQGSRTGHGRQMALACSSRLSFSLLRSKCGGGKKTTACGPRHAALTCHASSTRWALTDYPPSRADDTAAHRAKQGKVLVFTARGERVLPLVRGVDWR